MGRIVAEELASSGVSLEVAISYHLRGNHYPPVPTSMVTPCIEAIEAYNEMDSGRLIELPEGISYRGNSKAPAWAIIESHHLDPWLDYLED